MKYIPPWREPYFIGIAGCSGSGKTSVTTILTQRLNVPWTIQLSMDNFYKQLTDEQRQVAFRGDFDFDSPEAIDFELLMEVLDDLKKGKHTQVPVYSFKTHSRTDKKIDLYGANVVILEGILALYDPRVRDRLNLKIFVKEDPDVCMARRLARDILERERELESAIHQWHKFVKPNYIASILPTSRQADFILPNGKENHVAIDMLLGHIRRRLVAQSRSHLEDLQKLGECTEPIADLARILPETNQLRGIHTILVDKKTVRDDFIFYFNRMARHLVTFALEGTAEGRPETIRTPTGAMYEGLSIPFEDMAAVTIVRGGECFEMALKSIIPTIKLGRLLIQSDSHTGEPQLHTQKLPELAGRKVLLVDTQVLSGAAAVMACAILIDHGVEERDICFVVYCASEIGVRRIHSAFPHVQIVFALATHQPVILDLDARYYGT